VVLYLRAQGLGDGDEHPPTLSELYLYLFYTVITAIFPGESGLPVAPWFCSTLLLLLLISTALGKLMTGQCYMTDWVRWLMWS